jgi:hypothetical protein
MDYSVILSTVIGGAIALLGAYVSVLVNEKYRKAEWKRIEKYKLYTDIISILKKLRIPLIVEVKNINTNEMKLDIDELIKWAKDLHTYIEEKNAHLYLFLPKEIYKRMLILNSKIIQIIENNELQNLNIDDLKQSSIYEAVMFANTISSELRADLKL